MSRPNYRVVLSFDGERKVFIARIPELAHCSAEGATRGEAITRVEEELDAILHNLAERGGRPPSALDDTDHELTGELKVKVSAGLQRELTWQSHTEGVDLSQLAAELLAGRRPWLARAAFDVMMEIASDPHPDLGELRKGLNPEFVESKDQLLKKYHRLTAALAPKG